MNNATEIEWDIDNEKVSISFINWTKSGPNREKTGPAIMSAKMHENWEKSILSYNKI